MKNTQLQYSQRAFLLDLIDEAFNAKAWHGPNLRGSTRQVSALQAVWRVRLGRRNIAEVVLHCAYWKYATRRRICGDKRGSFTLKGSNWFAVSAKLSKEQWRDYVGILDAEHKALREAIATAPDSQLLEGAGDKRKPAGHVYGIAMHDTYHAGQIRFTKVLHKQAASAKK